jgi:nucleoside-triphosphatase THEP1
MKTLTKEHKEEFVDQIHAILNSSNYQKDPEFIYDILEKEQMQLVERARHLHRIPQDIAVNTPFKENILTMFICIYSRTPLFVCGKPGSSKTITVNILKKMFNSHKETNKLEYFDGFPQIKTEYYQGSEQSTDKGIDRIFRKALNGSKQNERLPLVFIDEIGLAELSIHNPLKVLHKYLDSTSHDLEEWNTEGDLMDLKKRKKRRKENVLNIRKEQKEECPILKQLKKWTLYSKDRVSFIGISNWNIDASKMNRNVYLARPDLDIKNLNDTGLIILKQKFQDFTSRTKEFKKDVRKMVLYLAKSYSNFRQCQKVGTLKI